jgi:hypothetical protein
MIVARLSLPGQSAPGPDPLQSVATARTEHIIGQRGARYPARDTPGSSAPPAASRPRATSADRSAALPPGQSWCSARRGDSPVLRNRGPSPPAPPFRLPPPDAAHPPHPPVSGLHTSAGPTRTQNSRIWSPAAAERPPTHGVHIGGSAHGYQRNFVPLAALGTSRLRSSGRSASRIFIHCRA